MSRTKGLVFNQRSSVENNGFLSQVLMIQCDSSASNHRHTSADPTRTRTHELPNHPPVATTTNGNNNNSNRTNHGGEPAEVHHGYHEEEEEELPDDVETRACYHRRLSTFSVDNWFGKPPSLSPVVCARFGWRVIQPDWLECEACGATWPVEFPVCVSSLLLSFSSRRVTQRLTHFYEQEMSSRHASTCRFFTEARLYREEQLISSSSTSTAIASRSSSSSTATTTTTTPPPISHHRRLRILPMAMRPLLHPRSVRRLWEEDGELLRASFRRHFHQVRTALDTLLPTPTKTPPPPHPRLQTNHKNDIEQKHKQNDEKDSLIRWFRWSWKFNSHHTYHLQTRGDTRDNKREWWLNDNDNSSNNNNSPTMSMLARIVEEIIFHDDYNNMCRNTVDSSSMDQLAVALILFGWSSSLITQTKTAVHQNSTSTPPCLHLVCPFTDSVLTLPAVSTTTTTTAIPRISVGIASVTENSSDIVRSHRYYSPFICGFACTAPIIPEEEEDHPLDLDATATVSGAASSSAAAASLSSEWQHPLWQILATRLLRSNSSSSSSGRIHSPIPITVDPTLQQRQRPVDVYEQAFQLLHSTVSPRLLKRPRQAENVL